jgi:hypothetical protein
MWECHNSATPELRAARGKVVTDFDTYAISNRTGPAADVDLLLSKVTYETGNFFPEMPEN